MAKETSREQDSEYTQTLWMELGMGSPHVWNVQHLRRKNASVRKADFANGPHHFPECQETPFMD